MERVGLKTRNELEKCVWGVGTGSWKVGAISMLGLPVLKRNHPTRKPSHIVAWRHLVSLCDITFLFFPRHGFSM